jgi:hypothetical protein
LEILAVFHGNGVRIGEAVVRDRQGVGVKPVSACKRKRFRCFVVGAGFCSRTLEPNGKALERFVTFFSFHRSKMPRQFVAHSLGVHAARKIHAEFDIRQEAIGDRVSKRVAKLCGKLAFGKKETSVRRVTHRCFIEA